MRKTSLRNLDDTVIFSFGVVLALLSLSLLAVEQHQHYAPAANAMPTINAIAINLPTH